MTIDLERILTCSLGDFYATQDEHFDKSAYMPIGVHVHTNTADIHQEFSRAVPDEAIVVVNYQARTFTGTDDIASGTALVPKSYVKKEKNTAGESGASIR